MASPIWRTALARSGADIIQHVTYALMTKMSQPSHTDPRNNSKADGRASTRNFTARSAKRRCLLGPGPLHLISLPHRRIEDPPWPPVLTPFLNRTSTRRKRRRLTSQVCTLKTRSCPSGSKLTCAFFSYLQILKHSMR